MATATGATTIDSEVLPLLRDMSFDGNIARLNCGQLDRKMYERTNKVLEALGGKWNRGKKGHAFEGCPEEVIGDAVSSGVYIDEKKAFQFFETPDDLADEMVQWAGVNGDRPTCLEPSAGNGQIIRAIKRHGNANIAAIEIDPKREGSLRELSLHTCIADFLTVAPAKHDVDFVLMNPPFTRSQDIDHVLHAFTFLKAGGVLVAIMASGFTFRSDRKAVEFRDWINSIGGEWRANDPGAFKSSGTMVNTVMVRIQK